MYAQVETKKENKSRAVANTVAQKKNNEKQGFGFVDNRQKGTAQFRVNKANVAGTRTLLSSLSAVKPVVQRSWTGKAATLLGTAAVGGISSLALPMVLPIGALAASAIGTLGYLGYKTAFGGPFIGGGNNIDTLQDGKEKEQTIGAGLINKKDTVSHSIAVVGEKGYHQQVNGELGTKDLVKSIFRTPKNKEAQAGFGEYVKFDKRKGRAVTVNVTRTSKRNAENATAKKGKTRKKGYELLTNSCSSNVADILDSAGLTPPAWAITPVLLHKWMKSMNLLQKGIPGKK